MTTTELTQRYFERLDELAVKAGSINRFYLFFDDELWNIEYALDGDRGFYDRLSARFRAWLTAMTAEERRELADYNRTTNGANQNGLLSDLLDNDGGLR